MRRICFVEDVGRAKCDACMRRVYSCRECGVRFSLWKSPKEERLNRSVPVSCPGCGAVVMGVRGNEL